MPRNGSVTGDELDLIAEEARTRRRRKDSSTLIFFEIGAGERTTTNQALVSDWGEMKFDRFRKTTQFQLYMPNDGIGCSYLLLMIGY